MSVHIHSSVVCQAFFPEYLRARVPNRALSKDLHLALPSSGLRSVRRYVPFRVFLHVRTQERVDSCLVTSALFLVPVDDVTVYPQRQLLLAGYNHEVSPMDCSCKHLRGHFRYVGKINICVRHRIYAFPISL